MINIPTITIEQKAANALQNGKGGGARSAATTTNEDAKVAFQEFVEIIPIESQVKVGDDRSEEQIWYNKVELRGFRNEARIICGMLRSRKEYKRYNKAGLCILSDRKGKARGLESRACLERCKRKTLCVKQIVQAARGKYRENPEALSRLAQKANRWAAALAVEEASRDFAHAWVIGASEPLLTPKQPKRALEEAKQNSICQRQIRRRVSQ